ncbi:hypothetical protein TNCV_1172461 [Trichonephila clavipes]|uniref:Uncharacterized protein n=1 Tax=Trichonephila clavipes TaxID=2585209 RepID=A0A8X6RWR9_TRICX|nr:hypothetical protein TNCV_1172461 [Trichonephila clavipes]
MNYTPCTIFDVVDTDIETFVVTCNLFEETILVKLGVTRSKTLSYNLLNLSTNFVVPAKISSQSSRHCWRSPLPHASALIQRDFGCVLGVQQTKQLPNVTKVDLVWQLGVLSGSIVEQPWTTCFLSAKDPESEPAGEAIQSGD